MGARIERKVGADIGCRRGFDSAGMRSCRADGEGDDGADSRAAGGVMKVLKSLFKLLK